MNKLKFFHYCALAVTAGLGYDLYPIVTNRGNELIFWIGFAVIWTVIFLDAYMENEREKMLPSRLAQSIGKIWGYFAVCFYLLLMVLCVGLTIWALIYCIQLLVQSRWVLAGVLFVAADVFAVLAMLMFNYLKRNLYYL